MTNAQILTAVILKWAEPVLPAIANNAVTGMANSMLPVEKFLKNWGLASPQWTMAGQIQSLVSAGGAKMIRPFLENAVSKIPDSMIPQIAHEYVDGAIQQGGITLFDKLTFEKEDLQELKKYLDCNLPYTPAEEYQVKMPNENNQQHNAEA